ncbi:hypothetical protein BSR28_01405 [Boudabousia liubingyangii]|uniref:M48 family metallopeptidase n=1 Tax=Boudabousia liubingyangii TaxID=1921764 RepID=UPI00093F6E01|nr:SprT family zinc-dependent metalloprotease [Boudabousia liubingyangii]OKL48386.1 hypothetical protein BSR28_01405 [Boudabousia liubingyangii]
MPASTEMIIEGLTVQVQRKPIKNLYIRVVPPDGQVRVSVPRRTSDARIRRFVAEKLDWVRYHQQQLRERPAVAPSANIYEDGAQVPLWGREVPLRVLDLPARARIRAGAAWLAEEQVIELSVHEGSTPEVRTQVMNQFYQEEVRREGLPLLEKWAQVMGLSYNRVSVKTMKSRWGSCSTKRRNISLNSELAKKDPRALEMVVVHELVHLLEPSHNVRFKALMSQYLPDWQQVQRRLNGR